MGAFVAEQAAQGVEAMAFGDLFLEDIRRYREAKLAGTGIAPLFPMWGIDTRALARDMIAGGLVARITCLDPAAPERFAGRAFDAALLAELPAGVDPCGENGEFHTFASRRPDVLHADRGGDRRGRHPRRLRLLRPSDPLSPPIVSAAGEG